MSRTARRLLAALLFFSLPLAAALSFAQGSAAQSASGLDLGAIDRSIDPCNDFYRYACGGWLATNPIPADRPGWGRFPEVQERNTEIMRRLLEAASSGRNADTKKIGDYYASCMDETAIEKRASLHSRQRSSESMG